MFPHHHPPLPNTSPGYVGRPENTKRNAKIDDFTARMFEAINGMLFDMLAAVARKDYEDRVL